MGIHTKEDELYKKATGYFIRAFDMALEQKDNKTLDVIMSNFLTLLQTTETDVMHFKHYWEQYDALPHKDDRRHAYNMSLLKGLAEMQSHDYAQSACTFLQQAHATPHDQPRLLYMAYHNLITATALSGDIRKALEYADSAQRISEITGYKDMEASACYIKYRYLEILKDTAQAQQYYMRYCHVRDTLLSYSQVTGLRETEFIDRMNIINREMEEIRYRNQIQRLITGGITALCVIVLAAAYIIKKKNRKLTQANKVLYQKTIDTLKAEEAERAERKKLQTSIEELKANLENAGKTSEKYSNRRISDDMKTQLFEKVRNVMETDNSIYSPGFSLKDLAEMVGSKQEYVSQVINEKCDCNFNEYLNSFRIKEACRRISDRDQYGQLTLMAIAESVGIKSATTFNKFFKQITGLSPSEFRKSMNITS